MLADCDKIDILWMDGMILAIMRGRFVCLIGSHEVYFLKFMPMKWIQRIYLAFLRNNFDSLRIKNGAVVK